VELIVFSCDLHGECTAGTALPPIACCAMCADFAVTDVSPSHIG
jgi:hypothetical protein